MRFCFLPLLRSELNCAGRLWNEHHIRYCKNSEGPSGKPDQMFFLPQLYGRDAWMSNYSLNNRPKYCWCHSLFTTLQKNGKPLCLCTTVGNAIPSYNTISTAVNKSWQHCWRRHRLAFVTITFLSPQNSHLTCSVPKWKPDPAKYPLPYLIKEISYSQYTSNWCGFLMTRWSCQYLKHIGDL